MNKKFSFRKPLVVFRWALFIHDWAATEGKARMHEMKLQLPSKKRRAKDED